MSHFARSQIPERGPGTWLAGAMNGCIFLWQVFSLLCSSKSGFFLKSTKMFLLCFYTPCVHSVLYSVYPFPLSCTPPPPMFLLVRIFVAPMLFFKGHAAWFLGTMCVCVCVCCCCCTQKWWVPALIRCSSTSGLIKTAVIIMLPCEVLGKGPDRPPSVGRGLTLIRDGARTECPRLLAHA